MVIKEEKTLLHPETAKYILLEFFLVNLIAVLECTAIVHLESAVILVIVSAHNDVLSGLLYVGLLFFSFLFYVSNIVLAH